MRVLVTGGGGFLGSALCMRLRQRGYEVLSYARHEYDRLKPIKVQQIRGDISNFEVVTAAFADVDAVFHVAAKAGAWGSFQEYFDANVRGTWNVIAACRMNRVRTLVYTSTPSVAHRGTRPVAGLNEQDALLADRYKSWYPASKRVAEGHVLAANGNALATVALRPRLIWGAGDNHLLPRLVDSAREGKLRFIGDGMNLVDTTYIDNAVQAHLDAFDALHEKPGAACAGKAYFISNGEPKPIADIINSLLRATGAPTVTQLLPYRVAYALATSMELTYGLLPLKGEPPLTRFLVEQLSTTHYYDISAAKRDFGYQPKISILEGLRQLGIHWRERSKDHG